MGRPREFDREDALQIAMKLFWERGFEGVSVADLTEAMNIATPSFYAAFSSKANLYRESLACYQRRPAALSTCPLEIDLPLREALECVLHMAIATVTELSPSSGCMIANGLLATSPEHSEIAQLTVNLRRGLITALQKRLERATRSGELAAKSNSHTLAQYLAAIVQGVSVQGHDGASAAELENLVQFALDSLPMANAATAAGTRRRPRRKLRSAPSQSIEPQRATRRSKLRS